jgi:hypothetical protein
VGVRLVKTRDSSGLVLGTSPPPGHPEPGSQMAPARLDGAESHVCKYTLRGQCMDQRKASPQANLLPLLAASLQNIVIALSYSVISSPPVPADCRHFQLVFFTISYGLYTTARLRNKFKFSE